MKWLDTSFLEDFIWAQSQWPFSYSSFIYGYDGVIRFKQSVIEHESVDGFLYSWVSWVFFHSASRV